MYSVAHAGNLFIGGIELHQNEETLVEYLAGFPLVKSLLQIGVREGQSAFRANSQSFSITGFKFVYLRARLAIE